MRISLVIPAGGSGVRFKESLAKKKAKQKKWTSLFSSLAKLGIVLRQKPLLAYSVETMLLIPEVKEIVIAVPQKALTEMRKWVKLQKWAKVKVVRGGKTRAESVLSGLRKTSPKNSWVMVHDGARPLVSKRDVQTLIRKSKGADGVILAKKVVPTIKEVNRKKEIVGTIDRDKLYEAETPQMMRRTLLLKAYKKLSRKVTTDEASLLELLGKKVKVVESLDWNPKVTTLKDLQRVEAYLNQGSPQKQMVVGMGKDIHRLVRGRKFYLGGLVIPHSLGALGHSDGDALLHAIIDAILGAMGKGDIGDLFSDQKAKFKNIRSTKLLKEVLLIMKKEHWQIKHVDTVISLERPKLKEYKAKIKDHIATLMGLEKKHVSIKAKTNEGLGEIGEGEAISCEAIVSLEKE